MNSRRLSPENRKQLGFLAFLLVYFLVLYVSLGNLSWEAQLFPLITLGGVAFLWALKLLATVVPRWKAMLEPEVGLFHDLAQAESALHPEERPRGPSLARKIPPIWIVWGWLLATIGAMYLLGFFAGMALSIACYLRLVTRESWRVALITTAITGLFVYLVFSRAMHIDLGASWLPFT
jgi:hypothetical protein